MSNTEIKVGTKAKDQHGEVWECIEVDKSECGFDYLFKSSHIDSPMELWFNKEGHNNIPDDVDSILNLTPNA